MFDSDEDIEPLTLFSITLTRTILANGEQGFTMTCPDKFSFIEVMGLIEAGKWHLYNQMNQRYGGE